MEIYDTNTRDCWNFFFSFKNGDYINIDVRKNIHLNEIELVNKEINNRLSYGSKSFNSPSKERLSRKIDPRIDSKETKNLGKQFFQGKTLLAASLYVSTFGIYAIYSIVTGVQFLVTKYIIAILEIEPLLVNIIFLVEYYLTIKRCFSRSNIPNPHFYF